MGRSIRRRRTSPRLPGELAARTVGILMVCALILAACTTVVTRREYPNHGLRGQPMALDPVRLHATRGRLRHNAMPIADERAPEWEQAKNMADKEAIPCAPHLFVVRWAQGKVSGRGTLNLAWLMNEAPPSSVSSLRFRTQGETAYSHFQYPSDYIGQIGYVWVMQVGMDLLDGREIRAEKEADFIGPDLVLKVPRKFMKDGLWVCVEAANGNQSNEMLLTEYARQSH